MRFLLLVSAASLLAGGAMAQTLLGQSQPGSGAVQTQAAVAVPEAPHVAAAPALVAPQPTQPTVAPPSGLVQTPLPPPSMVQQPTMPPDNGGGMPVSSGPDSVPQPQQASAASAQAVSPSVPVPSPAGSQAGVPASANSMSASSAVSPSASPGSVALAPSPNSDVAPAADNSWLYGHTAELGVLDKVDGSTEIITVPVGGQTTAGDLTVSVQACVTRPPGELPNAAVYLTLQTTKADASSAPIYQGWIVKSEPGAAISENADEAFRIINCS